MFFQTSPGLYESRYDTTRVVLQPSGTEAGLYVADKWRVLGPITADLGVRYDRHSYTGEGRTSPRVALALALGDRTVLRAAWGRSFQAQNIGDLFVEENVTRFEGAQLATHCVVGLERRLGHGLHLRVEGYHKALRHIRQRVENLGEDIEAVAEVEWDRISLFPDSGKIQGMEFYLKRDTGGVVSWWLSYAYAKDQETHHSSQVLPFLRGRTFPQKFSQRHTFSVDMSYRPSPARNLSLAWQIRSGWPFTPRELVTGTRSDGSQYVDVVFGDLYSDRYPPFHRLNLKINRRFTFQKLVWRFTNTRDAAPPRDPA